VLVPVATVSCIVCKQEVSKRSTLSLEVLGIGEGRACRSHQMVADAVQAYTDTIFLRRQLSAVQHRMRVMSAAAGIRILTTLGQPTELLYMRLRGRGFTDALIEEIRAEVQAQGGPTMTLAELGEAALTAMVLQEKKA